MLQRGLRNWLNKDCALGGSKAYYYRGNDTLGSMGKCLRELLERRVIVQGYTNVIKQCPLLEIDNLHYILMLTKSSALSVSARHRQGGLVRCKTVCV